MRIKLKKLDEKAVIPSFAKHGDAAVDLTATSEDYRDGYIQYGTGIAIEIPEGYFGLIRPRSSVSTKDQIFNTSGVIDTGYRGELMVRFTLKPHEGRAKTYEIGDRVAQLLILPKIMFEFEEVAELSDSERGAGGHGSSGK